ncbi:MAG: autotransporter domain-containing protein [Verrucomicrobiota bacterium]
MNWSPTAVDSGPVLLGADPDVVFSVVGGGANLNTNLGTVISISSLRVNEVNPVTIDGDGIGTPLTITGTGTIVPTSGINIESGAGLTTINANLTLGVANAQIVIVNNTAGLVVNGDMMGANGLTKQGTGVLTLTGTNTYVGPTNVMDGTLQLGDGVTTGSSIVPASAVTVGALGTLALNLADGETFENSVVNDGTIHWIANGMNTQHATSVFSGLGDMLITASGTTELLGANTFTGGTTIDTTGDVLVGNSSAFGSGLLTLTNGTIDTVNSQPLQISVGNYAQTGGELRIRLSGPGGTINTNYSVTGTADINGGTVFLYDANDIYDPDGYTPSEGDRQTIIDSTAVTGTGFADDTPDSLIQGINYSFGNTLLYPTLNYDVPGSVDVLWVQDSFAALPGGTPNQNSLGNALDAGAAPAAVTDFLNTQDVALLPSLFDLISPDELTSIYQMGFAGSDLQNANIQRHLERVRNSSPRETQYTETVTDSKGGMVQQQSSGMSDANRWSVFLEGHDGSASVDGDGNASGYDFDMRGATLGADMRVSERLVVGILGAYTESDAMLVNGGSIEDEAFKGAVYATYYDQAFYVDALLGVGSHSYDITRTGLSGTALGETDGWEIDAMINTGYDIKNGNWSYGPTASIAYTRIELDEFSETGSLAPLRFPSQHQDSLRSQLGAKIAYTAEFCSMRIIPQVRLAWQHEFMDGTQSIDSSFVGGSGASFSTSGPSMDEDRFVVGAGLTVEVTPNFSIYGSYDGNIGSSDYNSNQVTAGIKFDF